MFKSLKYGFVTVLLMCSMASMSVAQSGPYSAQIQRALATFIKTAHTWTGTQTFTNITVSGTCTGCGASFPLTLSTTGLGTTSTDGEIISNTTAATIGTTIQISPRLRFRANGWDIDDAVSRTVDYFVENVPITGNTVTSGLHFGYSLAGGAVTDAVTFINNVPSVSGSGIRLGAASAGGLIIARNTSGSSATFRLGDDSANVGIRAADIAMDPTGYYDFAGRSLIRAPADGQFTFSNNAETALTRLNFGGNTSSFPAFGINGTKITQVLSDGTSGGSLAASDANITVGSGTGITVNDTGSIRDQTYKVTVAFTNFIAAATTADVTIATLPAKTAISAVVADLTQTFACGSTCTTATLSMTCGKTAGGNEYALSFDADAATAQFGITQATIGAALKYATPPITLLGDIPSWSLSTPVQCRLTSGTGNLGTGAATNLSQGSITFYLTTTKLP